MWFLLACARPDQEPSFPPGATVIDHVAVIDADGIREDRAVLLLEARLERVTDAGQDWPDDATVIDGTGRSLLPGLVDSHVHLATAGTTVSVGDKLAVNLRATLAAGVTEVVDLGGPTSLFALRDAIARGDAIGPRIHASGPFLTAGGSHPCETFPDPTLCVFVDADDASAAAEAHVEAGADVLKVALADAAFTPWGATPRLDLDALDAIVGTGLPVYAHVDTDEDVIDAVDHGVRVLAHPTFATEMGPDALAAAARADAVTTTLSAFANAGRLGDLTSDDPDIAANWAYIADHPDEMLDGWFEENAAWAANVRANLPALRAAGARVIPGSDAGYYFVPHGTGLLDELDAMVTLGWTPLEAITAATLDAREVIGAEGGRVEAGAPADLVLVMGDPTEDLAALRQVDRVFLGGIAWNPDAGLLPAPVEGVCLGAEDCAGACDPFTHACADACETPYAVLDTCGADAWCMPDDGIPTTATGACHAEETCDLYAQDCVPGVYGMACIPFDADTNACWYGGPRTAGEACSTATPETSCAPGLYCSRIDARCYTLCDPDGPETCAVGRCQLQYAEAGVPWMGLCL